MKAIIFGGAGFIGGHLYARLRALGYELRVLDIVAPTFEVRPGEYVACDVRKPIADLPGFEGAPIYNFAAVHRTPGHPAHEYYETNVFGALNVTEFAKRNATKQLVFTSSISVYGPGEDEKTERSEPKPVSDYGKSKLMAEGIHRAWLDRVPGSRLVIARPAVVFGPNENGNFTRLYHALAKRRFVYPGRRSTIKSCGYVDELLATFDFALGLGRPEFTYNFAYRERWTIEQICDTFGATLGTKPPLATLPFALMRTIAKFGLVLAWLGVRTPIHPERIDKLYMSTNIIPEALVQNGYRYQTTLASALQDWHAKSGGRMI